MTTQCNYYDWNPENVDLLSCCGIARHFGYPLELVWKMARHNPAFPPYRRDSRGCRQWRLPDLNEFFDGECYRCSNKPGSGNGVNRTGLICHKERREQTMPQCSVDGCTRQAVAEVLLYDLYEDGTVFFEQDFTCPFICAEHMIENEQKANGERRPRGFVDYPYTNRHAAQGFTVYRPL